MERLGVEIDTGPPTPQNKKFVWIVEVAKAPPRMRSAGLSTCSPEFVRARIMRASSWVPVSLAWVPGNFSPRHVPGGRARFIQFLGRPLSS